MMFLLKRTRKIKVLYFVSCIKKKIHDKTYKDNIKRLLEEYTNTYYAYRAYSKENDKNFMRKRNLPIKTKNLKIGFPYGDNKKVSDFFENFSVLNDLSPYDDFRIQDILIKSWIEYKKGNRALSSVYARDYINSSDVLPDREHTVWKLAYPIYYAELINKYSEINDLNPYLILSLIKEESHFNPSIQSYVGASGLMQIMPSTAHMVSGINYKYGDLINEELNIQLGTKYFKYLMDGLGIPCVLVIGTGTNSEGQTEDHAWNYVEVDGKWYAVDTTWDDPIIKGNGTIPSNVKYKYFLKGEQEFNKDHTPSGYFTQGGKLFTYPTLSSVGI